MSTCAYRQQAVFNPPHLNNADFRGYQLLTLLQVFTINFWLC